MPPLIGVRVSCPSLSRLSSVKIRLITPAGASLATSKVIVPKTMSVFSSNKTWPALADIWILPFASTTFSEATGNTEEKSTSGELGGKPEASVMSRKSVSYSITMRAPIRVSPTASGSTWFNLTSTWTFSWPGVASTEDIVTTGSGPASRRGVKSEGISGIVSTGMPESTRSIWKASKVPTIPDSSWFVLPNKAGSVKSKGSNPLVTPESINKALKASRVPTMPFPSTSPKNATLWIAELPSISIASLFSLIAPALTRITWASLKVASLRTSAVISTNRVVPVDKGVSPAKSIMTTPFSILSPVRCQSLGRFAGRFASVMLSNWGSYSKRSRTSENPSALLTKIGIPFPWPPISTVLPGPRAKLGMITNLSSLASIVKLATKSPPGVPSPSPSNISWAIISGFSLPNSVTKSWPL